MTNKILTGVSIGVVSVLATVASTEGYAMPRGFADAWRVVSMTLAGFALGAIWLIGFRFSKLNFDDRDKLRSPLAWVGFSYFLVTAYIGTDLASRFGENRITWRTPYSFAAYLTMLVSIKILSRRLRHALRRADQRHARVKLTITDTSTPGPDIDLTDAHEVEHEKR